MRRLVKSLLKKLKKNKPVHCAGCLHHFCIVPFTNEEDRHICLAKSRIVSKSLDPISGGQDIDGWELCYQKNQNNDCFDFVLESGRVSQRKRIKISRLRTVVTHIVCNKEEDNAAIS